MNKHGIALIGLGKIAEDQHLPVIAASERFELVATTSRRGVERGGVPTFRSPGEMLAAAPEARVVAICTPPGAHHMDAREALLAGRHVLLEKPPAATLGEIEDLAVLAAARGLTLFTTWHSQFNAAVEEARRRLAGATLRSLHVAWKEDVRHWHPGQEWIWEAGGFGVFDPAINAFSILTRILPGPLLVARADLHVPANRHTPVRATLAFTTPTMAGSPADAERFTAELDWLQEGEQTWSITVETTGGTRLELTRGGAVLAVDGETVVDEPPREYTLIYERLAELLDAGTSLVETAPLRLVADAFLVGRRFETAAFHWDRSP